MKPSAIFCLLLLAAASCDARLIIVGSAAYANFNNIQAAIDDSNDGDEIIVTDGTYTGPGNRDIDYGGRAITIYSQSGPDFCIIDCNGTEAEPHRGFYFHNGEDANSVLQGITIKNGYSSSAAGGIACVDSSPTIIDCRIIDCTAVSAGGGIYCGGGAPTVLQTQISGNSAQWGGGLYGCAGSFEQCEITANTAQSRGGGLYDCFCSLKDCTISGNRASFGAGIGYCHIGPAVNCLITANSADANGGGVYFSDIALENCTITGNRALDSGGGIWRSSGLIENCIIWDNNAPSAPQIYDSSTPVYSCIAGGAGLGLGNIDIDPCFVLPGRWDTNGTPDDTNDDVWLDGDYHLKTYAYRWDVNSLWWTWDENSSRCIDAGNPGCDLADEPLTVPPDPQNEWGHNVRINMGRYGGTAQASMAPYDWYLLCDLTNDLKVDIDDLKPFADYWQQNGGCLPADLDRDRSADFRDFAVFAGQWDMNVLPPTPPPPPNDTTPPAPEPNFIINPDFNTVNPADNSLSGQYKIGQDCWHKIVAGVADITDDSGGEIEIKFICLSNAGFNSISVPQFGTDISDPDGNWTITYDTGHIIYDVYVTYGGIGVSLQWKVCAYDPSDNEACSAVHTIGPPPLWPP